MLCIRHLWANVTLVFALLQTGVSYFKNQGFFGAERRALAAFDTFVVIYGRCVVAVLRKRADGAHLYCGARVVLRTVLFFDSKHFCHDISPYRYRSPFLPRTRRSRLFDNTIICPSGENVNCFLYVLCQASRYAVFTARLSPRCYLRMQMCGKERRATMNYSVLRAIFVICRDPQSNVIRPTLRLAVRTNPALYRAGSRRNRAIKYPARKYPSTLSARAKSRKDGTCRPSVSQDLCAVFRAT